MDTPQTRLLSHGRWLDLQFRMKKEEGLNFLSRENTIPLRKHSHALCKDFKGCKNAYFQMIFFDIFLIFAQNIDRGYDLTSTHNLCFRAKIRK